MTPFRTLAALAALGLTGCPAPSVPNDVAADRSPDGLDDAADIAIDASSSDAAPNPPDGSPDAADADGALASGTIVPLYTYPTDATWTRIAVVARAHPRVSVIAVVNPNNGPTPAVEPSFATGIHALAIAGITVIGYVPTAYGARAVGDVNADVDLYHAQYPDVSGIFFDEAAIYETGHETTYTSEASHARYAGLRLLVANPGTTPINAYSGLFDVALVYESAGVPTESSLRVFGPMRSRCGIIPYAVPTLDPAYVRSIRSDVQYVFVTDDVLPNPWDTLPAYFDSLLTALE